MRCSKNIGATILQKEVDKAKTLELGAMSQGHRKYTYKAY